MYCMVFISKPEGNLSSRAPVCVQIIKQYIVQKMKYLDREAVFWSAATIVSFSGLVLALRRDARIRNEQKRKHTEALVHKMERDLEQFKNICK